MKTKVVIVDDHRLITKAIASIINDFLEFEVIYDAENGSDLISKLSTNYIQPEIILLDVSMPVMNGIQTAEWLQENKPEIRTMALSVQDDEETLLAMIKNGAKGYLHKNVHPDELEAALRGLRDQGVYFPAWASTKIANSMLNSNSTKRSTDKIEDISAREAEFLSYVCLDLTYKEIADKMCCSHRTVEGYRDSLFEKLNMHSRVALALFAVKKGYYEL